MSLIEGRPIKWGALANSDLTQQATEIACRWASIGILHLRDAEIFGDTTIRSIIDFATANKFEELEQYWHEHGVLPPVAIQAWGVRMRD